MVVVSGLCVSHPSRFECLKRAIINFRQQTIAPRELVIMVRQEGYLQQIEQFLANELEPLKDVTVKAYSRNFRALGGGITQAAICSRGDWLCCWDDDNLSHPGRLEQQIELTEQDIPSFLATCIYHFYESEEIYLANCEQPSGPPSQRCVPSSFLCHREYFHSIDELKQSHPMVQMADTLGRKQIPYHLISELPYSFVVGVRGDNMMGYNWHRRQATELPATRRRAWLVKRAETIEGMLKDYRWPNSTMDVCGKDAQAFVAEGLPVWPKNCDNFKLPEDGSKIQAAKQNKNNFIPLTRSPNVKQSK